MRAVHSGKCAMKILHIVRQFHPAIGGLEDAVANLTQQLSSSFDVRVLTLDRLFTDRSTRLAPHDRFGAVDVTRIGFSGSTRYPLAPAVLRHLGDADIVHVHAIDFFFDYLAMTRAIHGKTLVASTHGGFFHTGFARPAKRVWFNSVTRTSARSYAAICASSDADAAMFAAIAPDRTTTVANGVDIAKFRDTASPLPVPVMLCLGRFSSNKRIAALFPVLRALLAQDRRWQLIIAGVESDLSRHDLEEAARAAGVTDQTEIIVAASVSELRVVISRASYIVSASAHEGFGLSIVEGLSAGLTPLVSAIPAFVSLIASTGRGTAIDVDKPQAAAAAISAQHATTASHYPAERSANIAASNQFGWPAAAARFAEVYRTVKKPVLG